MVHIESDDIVKRFGVYFIAKHNGKDYYCKEAQDSLMYNEFIAEEIADEYGIKHASYLMGKYNNKPYVMSESVYDKETEELYSLEDLFEMYKEYDLNLNMLDIWYFFEKYYPKNVITLMNELINVFLFDALIGNSDRHFCNICFILDKKTGNLRVSPVFDNEILGEKIAISNGFYCMGIDQDSYLNEVNYLLDFFRNSNEVYKDYFKSKLDIISKENLDKIFERLESKGIVVPDVTRVIVKSNMYVNKKMINKVFKQLDSGKSLSLAM